MSLLKPFERELDGRTLTHGREKKGQGKRTGEWLEEKGESNR